MNLTVIQEALEGKFQLELASNGIDGLALAKAFQPEVILLDVMMPGLDGLEVCRRAKQTQSLRHARIIMVSAKSLLDDRLAGYDAGADDYVTKPFDEEELITKIDFAIRARRLEQLCGSAGELIALVAWLRDSGVEQNIATTRALSRLVAEQLRHGPYAEQIDDRFLDDLHHAAILRDVGLLAIPHSLRSRTAALSHGELEKFKQHTLVGARLLNRFAADHPDATVFRVACQVARSHHENFDGSGYPDHLAGVAIPLAARILRAVECVEKLNSADSWAAHTQFERAQQQLRQASATAFDPHIVEALLEVLDQHGESECEELSPAGFEEVCNFPELASDCEKVSAPTDALSHCAATSDGK
jgi:putative two-component system response regulator